MGYGKGLSEGMESRSPRDLPGRNVRNNELNLQVKFVEFVKDNAGQEVVENEVGWDLKKGLEIGVDAIHLSI